MTKLSELTKIKDELVEKLLNEPLLCSSNYPKEIKAAYRIGFDAATSIFTEREKVLMSVIEKQKEALALQLKRSKETAIWIEKHYFENDEGNGEFYVKAIAPFNELEIMREECKLAHEEVSKMMEGLND